MIDLIELVLLGTVIFIGAIMVLAAIVFGIWCYAAYKWMTRRKWQNGKTRNGNPRV